MAKKENNKKAPQPPRKTKKQDSKGTPTEPSNRRKGLSIVGIGASAGGLKALQSFFAALPVETGLAFVVVTHLHPEHESHMAELLEKPARMPTSQVREKVRVEPDHVYIIPPNRNILLTDSHLDVVEFEEPHGHRTPIDHFFRSLANGHSDSIAIILSGGGTDGAVGIKDVKEQGGLLMVQHPEDAEYDSMPRAAIGTGLADVILPADQLAEKLVDYTRHRPELPHDANQLSENDLETLQRILSQVHARTGNDFSQYKRSTILRRVERRMQLNGFDTLGAYLNFMRHNASEATAMFNDILIGVTNFFRDRKSWEAFETQVIPALFENRDEDEGIRVWSIGCATGEEAYGLAIMLFEHTSKLEIPPHFQIFASDLDEKSILHAREGLYPTAIEADVSPERLDRFFSREGEYYRVKRELRDAVLFTNHNVLRDPPFSRQDLIACRNVLIYLQRDVQDRLFDIFHYALHPHGYLFLGSSETVEHLPELFSIVDKTNRLYQAKPWTKDRPHIPSMPFSTRKVNRTAALQDTQHPHLTRFMYMDETSAAEGEHEKMLEAYGPPSIVIDERHMVVHVSETAGRYLLQPKGQITGDLLKLVRPELQLELRTTLFRAFEKDRATISRPVSVQFNGHARRVVISVRPRTELSDANRGVEKQALVFFLEDQLDEPVEEMEITEPHEQGNRDKLLARLEAEVQRLREQLQITIEEYDSSNEEMKAANEELQSINEEYRSATEELETSKEELQSMNEELQTVNSEMRGKLEEITRAHKELENLMGASEIPTLFLDRELRIQRFTAGIKELFNIIAVDRGRPLSDLTHKLGQNQLAEDAENVLRRLVPLEREIHSENGVWFLVRLRPYRTVEDKIEGVVISFIDITAAKQIEEELLHVKEALEDRARGRTRELDDTNRRLNQAQDRFSRLFHVNPIPTSIASMDNGTFIDINQAYLDFCGLTRDEIVDHTSEELKLPLAPEIRPGLIARVQKEGLIRNIQLDITLPSGEAKTILASLQYLHFGGVDALMLAFNDISERVRGEREVRTVASNLTSAEQAERTRIARVLHDDLQQNIFAVKMQLSMLRDSQGRNEENSRVDLAQLDEWLTEAIATTRQLSVDLSPPILQGEGLTEAVIWLGAQMKEQYKLDVTVEANGVHAVFDEDVRLLVFQTVRELLFNVVKHSETTRATVTFKQLDGEVSIMVSDDGKGFDPEQVMENWKSRHGLLRMRDRLFLLGCNLKINSAPKEGTRITIEAPVKSL